MAEFHPENGTKEDCYNRERHSINQKYDKKIQNKCFLTSKSSIEADRKQELDKLHDDYYPKRGGGFALE